MNNSILKFINTYKYELMIGVFTIGLLYYEQRNTPEFALAMSSWPEIKREIEDDGSLNTEADWTAAAAGTGNQKIESFRSFVSNHRTDINAELASDIPLDDAPNIPQDASTSVIYAWLFTNWWNVLKDETFMNGIGDSLNETIDLQITHPTITLSGSNNFTKPEILGYYMKVFGKTGSTWQNLLMPLTASVPGAGEYESGSIYGSHALLELFYNDTDADKSLLGSSPGSGSSQSSNLIFRSLRYFLELNYENSGDTIQMTATNIFDAVDASGVTRADKRSKGFFLKTLEPDGAAISAQPETFQLNRTGIRITSSGSAETGAHSIVIPSSSYNLEDIIRARILEENATGNIVTQLRFELWTVANWKWLKTPILVGTNPSSGDIIANYVDISATMKSGNIILGVMPVVYIPRPSQINVNIGGTAVDTSTDD